MNTCQHLDQTIFAIKDRCYAFNIVIFDLPLSYVVAIWTEGESRLGRKWNVVDDLPESAGEDKPSPPRSLRHRQHNTESNIVPVSLRTLEFNVWVCPVTCYHDTMWLVGQWCFLLVYEYKYSFFNIHWQRSSFKFFNMRHTCTFNQTLKPICSKNPFNCGLSLC